MLHIKYLNLNNFCRQVTQSIVIDELTFNIEVTCTCMKYLKVGLNENKKCNV